MFLIIIFTLTFNLSISNIKW